MGKKNRVSESLDKVEKLKLLNKMLLKEASERGKHVNSLTQSNVSLELELTKLRSELSRVSNKFEEDLTRTEYEHGLVVKEMGEFQEAKDVEMSELNEIVVSLQEGERRLLLNVAELEDKCVEAEEKKRVMVKKIDRLLEERKSNEKSIEGLMDEQIMLEKKLQETLIQLHNFKCKLEHLVKQNIGLMEAKRRLDCDVGLFQKQVAELKTVIWRLEEYSKVRELKVKSLQSEVENYSCKLKRVEAERSKLENCMHEEKQNVVTLKEQMENKVMKLEESVKGAGKVKAENGMLLVKKIDLENQCEIQKKEIASLKDALDKAQNEFSKMKGKIELADAESKLVMNMLDRTHAFCLKGESKSKDGDFSGKKTGCEEAKQCGMKFEMIKNAFEVKEAKIDSMGKQLEFLKNYVEEANKKNILWDDLSFAVILLAALFIAYISFVVND